MYLTKIKAGVCECYILMKKAKNEEDKDSFCGVVVSTCNCTFSLSKIENDTHYLVPAYNFDSFKRNCDTFFKEEEEENKFVKVAIKDGSWIVRNDYIF